jgi:uncharacterized damage-inducible protein DinB
LSNSEVPGLFLFHDKAIFVKKFSMNKEIQSIIKNLQRVIGGQPWYGRPVYELLGEVKPNKVFEKPGSDGHSMIELLYHMVTWTEFCLRRVQGAKDADPDEVERLDWRKIDPSEHNWEKGLAAFKEANNQIIELLSTKNDDFLKQIVDYREFNFRFLLNGLIQHHIYHIGQIAYIEKFLV